MIRTILSVVIKTLRSNDICDIPSLSKACVMKANASCVFDADEPYIYLVIHLSFLH
jgi:hypothetical protein